MEDMRHGVIITVFSTASAVGKTLVSINMAAELAAEGYRVCLLDLDLQFGDIGNYLKLQPQVTLADAQRALAKDAAHFRAEAYLETYQKGEAAFSVLSAPLRLDEAYNIKTACVERILQQLQGQFDYLVLDTTSAFSELNLAVMDRSTIVTFLGIVDFIPTIKNMKSGSDTLRGIGYDANKIRLVLNRSNSKTRIDLADVEKLLGEPFYHVLTNDFAAAQASIQEGCPLVLTRREAGLAEDLRHLVGRYTNRGPQEDEPMAEHSWLKRIFK